MNRLVRVAPQVVAFVRTLAPEQRRSIRRGLRDLGAEVDRNIKSLDGTLTGYSRLRIGRFRLIFWYAPDTAIEVVFAEDRSVVYEIFEAEFVKRLKARYPDQETSPGDFQVQESQEGLDSKLKRKSKKTPPSRKAVSAEIKTVMRDYSRTMRRLSATEVYERGAAKYRNALRELSKQ